MTPTDAMVDSTVRQLRELDTFAPWVRVYVVTPVPGALPFHTFAGEPSDKKASGFLQVVVSDTGLQHARALHDGIALMEREWQTMMRSCQNRIKEIEAM